MRGRQNEVFESVIVIFIGVIINELCKKRTYNLY